MTVNKLISSLVSNAKKESEEIIKSAESEVDRLIAEEKAKRVLLLKNAEEDCERLLKDQKRERVAWARLEARRLIAEAKEDAIHATTEDMYGMLGDLKKSGDYPSFMKKSVSAAVDEFGADYELVLHVAKGDKKLITKFKGKIVEDLDSVGGFILERADGKVCIDMTLSSILESRKDDLRKKIYEKLFEGSQKASSSGKDLEE